MAGKGPSEAEWDYFKPVITHLYFEVGMKLEDVRCEMEESFGFRASRKMYNTRIRRWGIKKNYSASEKQDVADELLANREAGIFRVPEINGRPVKRLDKVDRYLRMRKTQTARMANQELTPVKTCKWCKRNSYSDRSTACRGTNKSRTQIGHLSKDAIFQEWLSSLLPREAITKSMGACNHEKALHLWNSATHNWIVQSRLSNCTPVEAFLDEESYSMLSKWHADVTANIVHLRRSLELSSNEDALSSLDAFCETVKPVLKRQYWPFILQFVAETIPCLWVGFSGWRAFIFNFLVQMSSIVLGEQNTTTQLLSVLAQDNLIDDVSATMMQLSLDMFDNNNSSAVSHFYEMLKSGINVFIWKGDMEGAKRRARRYVKEAEYQLGRGHWVTHRALRILAFILKRNDELVEARDILLTMLDEELIKHDGHQTSSNERATDLLVFLGDVCGRLGSWREGEQALRRFLCLIEPGTSEAFDEWRWRANLMLAETLLRQGKLEEVQKLPALDDSLESKRALAWAKLRLKYWPTDYNQNEILTETGEDDPGSLWLCATTHCGQRLMQGHDGKFVPILCSTHYFSNQPFTCIPRPMHNEKDLVYKPSEARATMSSHQNGPICV